MTQFSAVNVPTIVCIYLVLQHYTSLQPAPAPGVFSSDHSTGGSTARAVQQETFPQLAAGSSCFHSLQTFNSPLLWRAESNYDLLRTLHSLRLQVVSHAMAPHTSYLGHFINFKQMNVAPSLQQCSSAGVLVQGGRCVWSGCRTRNIAATVLSSSPLKLARPSPDFSMMF